jgi:hypothetical protein
MFVFKLVLALIIIIAALILVFRFHKQIKEGNAAMSLGKKGGEGSADLEAFIAAYRRDQALGAGEASQTTAPPAPATSGSAAQPAPLAPAPKPATASPAAQPASPAPVASPAAAKARAAFLSGPIKLGFLVLKAGLPDHHVFANTRVSDLLDGLAIPGLANARVDLVVCNKDLAIVAAVDLPNGAQVDSLIEREKEQRLRAAGIRYLRLEPGAFPKPAQVRELIYKR